MVRFDEVEFRGGTLSNVNPVVRTVLVTGSTPVDKGLVAALTEEKALVLIQRTAEGRLLDAAVPPR